jgi:hypothetical protein
LASTPAGKKWSRVKQMLKVVCGDFIDKQTEQRVDLKLADKASDGYYWIVPISELKVGEPNL